VTAGAPTASAAPRWERARVLARGPDRWPVAVLVVLPVVVFVVPAALGYPAISYDNLLQNFPLRVLSGQLFASGHLPLWNPTIWSGSPLLAGLNAGSFYPTTLVFAVLPAVGAWVVNLIVPYWAAGLGLYALVRQYGLRPLACFLAALTYQFGGAMVGQLVHLGIIQGMGWMPLVVLAEVRLSWAVLGTGPCPPYRRRPVAVTSPWPWVGLLGAVMGLNLLTGEPRSMAETEIVGSVLLAWLALRGYPGDHVGPARRLRLIGYAALSALWAVALGASELLPGRSFILASQRASENYAFFGLGSLRPSWSILMLVPNLFGGNGVFGQPAFSIGYNLPEVTGYMGLLPLAAFLVLLVRGLGRHADPRARDWRPWLFLAPLGLLLAWGVFTPLGHLFAEIPFYNKVRLQSRNLQIVDLALAVLFAFWLELFLSGEWRERAARPLRWLREVAVPAVFPVAGLAAALTMTWFPLTVLTTLGAQPIDPNGRRPWMAAQAAVALGALAVVVAWRMSRPRLARRLLGVVVVADLGLFNLACSTGMWAGGQPEPTRAEGVAALGAVGRFAIVGVPSIAQLSSISEPDINALTGLDSVQGYGSILSGTYDQVTGTHFMSTMDPCALARGVFVPLRLATVLVLPGSLIQRLAPGEGPSPPPRCQGAPLPGSPTRRTFYLGRTLEVSSVVLVAAHPPSSAPRVGVVDPAGALRYPAQRASVVRHGWRVRFAVPVAAQALEAVGPGGRGWSETSTLTTATGTRDELDGPFQAAFGQPVWRQRGFWEDYARFETDHLGPKVTVLGVRGARAAQRRVGPEGEETDVVATPRPALVVRSEAYLAGWRVRATPAGGGRPLTLPVVRVGLLQGVRVPAGRWTLTFTYWPPGLSVGGLASAVGVAALLAMVAWRLVLRRRADRNSPRRAH
jgi:hypothetical protein